MHSKGHIQLCARAAHCSRNLVRYSNATHIHTVPALKVRNRWVLEQQSSRTGPHARAPWLTCIVDEASHGCTHYSRREIPKIAPVLCPV